FWDPHTHYRTPMSYGEPFANDPIPAWYTDDVRKDHWSRPGPHTARECRGWTDKPHDEAELTRWPRQQWSVPDLAHARKMFDGYDTGVRYTDDHLAFLFNALKQQGVYDDTAIIISADHGENLGE